VRYSVRPGRLAATAEEMEAIAARWEHTLAALKRVAEGTAPADGERRRLGPRQAQQPAPSAGALSKRSPLNEHRA
jgi:hypothetical protein